MYGLYWAHSPFCSAIACTYNGIEHCIVSVTLYQPPWPYLRCITVLTSALCSPPTSSRQQCGHEQGSKEAQKHLPAWRSSLELEGPPGGISCTNACPPLLRTDWHLLEWVYMWVCVYVCRCVGVWVWGSGCGECRMVSSFMFQSVWEHWQSADHMPTVTSYHMIGACASASWSMGVEFGDG